MQLELIQSINKLIETLNLGWSDPTIIVQIVSIIITIIFSFLMYKVTKNQKIISEKQQMIQNNQFKYELFEKRYEIYKTTFILEKKLSNSYKLLDKEYKEKFEDCIRISEFIFNKDFSNVLKELYELALLRDKIKMIVNENYSIGQLISERDLIILKWNIKLEEFLRLDENEQKLSLDERSLVIPDRIREIHDKAFKEYLTIEE